MTQKEDIKKVHEMIKEIAPSKSMGDFGLKEKLCIELLKWKEEQLIEKACKWFLYINEHNEDIACVEDFIENFKKAMEE